MSEGKCISCGEQLTGKFCHACGEKVIVPEKDYSLVKFFEQTLEGITHFDSKFFKSFAFILYKPGFLTQEYILGRRKRYMNPIQIFAICSLLFFLAFPRVTSFFANAGDLISNYDRSFSYGNVFHYNMLAAIDEHMLDEKTSQEVVIAEIHREAAHKSKLFLVMIIPVWGILLYGLFYKWKPYLSQHLVFATHALSFFILLDMIFITSYKLLGYTAVGDREIYVLISIFFIYLAVAIGKFYGLRIVKTVVKSVFAFGTFVIILIVYRQLITIWTIHFL